jgi:hypothetical protein
VALVITLSPGIIGERFSASASAVWGLNHLAQACRLWISSATLALRLVALANMISLQPVLSDSKYKTPPGVTENFPGWFLHIFKFPTLRVPRIRSIMRPMFVSFAFLFFINVLAAPVDPSSGNAVALRVSRWIRDSNILNCLYQRRSPNEHYGSSRAAQQV